MIGIKIEYDFKSIQKRFEEITDEHHAEYVRALYSEILKHSPVDSGKFRANWNIGVGGPKRITYETTETDFNKASRLANSLRGKDVYIDNFLPYAANIEYGRYKSGPKTVGGFSKKAPQGVLGPSIRSLVGSMS
jgi:hypothetical protein